MEETRRKTPSRHVWLYSCMDWTVWFHTCQRHESIWHDHISASKNGRRPSVWCRFSLWLHSWSSLRFTVWWRIATTAKWWWWLPTLYLHGESKHFHPKIGCAPRKRQPALFQQALWRDILRMSQPDDLFQLYFLYSKLNCRGCRFCGISLSPKCFAQKITDFGFICIG